MSVRRAVVTVVLVLAVTLVASVEPAAASCHHFTVSTQPSRVLEGGSVTVTVTRDGSDEDSSVQVRTVEGSASSGQDFFPVNNQTVTFGEGELSKSISVGTVENTTPEGDEQFRLRLRNGAGCDGGPFEYGPDATVTIVDDDAPATTTTTTLPTTTSSSTTSSSTTSSTSSSTTSTTAPTTTSTEEDEIASGPTTTLAAAGTGLREEGGGSWILPLALGVLAAAFFGGILVVRHRIVAHEGDVEG